MRKSFFSLSIFIVLGCFFLPLGLSAKSSSSKRPNILFIMADDHAFQAIGAYGSRINKTPNIDRLAKEGIRFDNFFVTNSICAPCRAVILTGKHSHLNGVLTNRERFDPSQQTFPKLLQRAGYQTAIIGKWHLKTQPSGFDYWEVLIGQGSYYNPTMVRNGKKVRYEGYTTEIITNLALKWLKEGRDPGKPFCLMVHHKAPHRNWQPSPKYFHLYDDVKIAEPPTFWDDYRGRASPASLQEMTIAHHLNESDLKLIPPRGLTEDQLEAWQKAYGPKNEAFRKSSLKGADLVRWKYQRFIKDYLRCIASVDDSVGALLDYLDRSGLAENTVVIYTSDQGFYLGEHGWFDKRWMYRQSFKNALLLRWPGVVRPGTVNKDLCQNLDLAPTFLQIAGVPIPSDMQGRSLVPLLRGETPKDWRTSLYYQYYEFPGAHSVRRHYGVRTKRYKLIFYYNLGEWELFDLKKDPYELKSVYSDPVYAGVVKELKAELERLRRLYRVPPDTGRLPKRR